MGRRYIAFWSYTSFDDDNDDAWVSSLRKGLIAEVRALFGKRIEIFQDLDGIAWGERWKQKLVSSSDDAVFLVPIVTPSYSESDRCREELEQFVEREKTTGFNELILPVYYIDAPQLQDEFARASDFLGQVVADHNYQDIRSLRHRSITSFEAKQKIKELATALMNRLHGYARRQISLTDMRAQFTAPDNQSRVPQRASVSGSLDNISEWADVWLVVQTGAVYHPQIRLAPDSGTFQESVAVGRSGLDQKQEFSVHVLAVTEDVTKAFERYCKDAAKYKKWPGIPKPTDSRILATVKVIRNDSP